nr:ATP-dependent helicase HrpB [Parapontixanthobacter aurantiacus]
MIVSDLPIHAVLPDLLAALREDTGAVLVAPPGAGKTTAVAPALIGEDWCAGQVIMTSPRRLAARAAAERMAELLGEPVGRTVGYTTRLDTKQSAATRILVVTEAILVNRIVADPELPGVSAILFDEAHERHLDGDLGLALALESRAVLNEKLRLLVMSATIDGARFARLLGGNARVIESEGKAHPLEVRWLGTRAEVSLEDAMSDAVLTALRETEGDLLAFLPGVREIERVRERLEARLGGVPVLPLHGQVEPAAQRAALRRDTEGRRIVLATSIAETSLTLDGVSVVVDSGLARQPEFDRAAGRTHLVTVAASQAATAQRAGRAARQGPGVAYRLWNEASHAGRPAFSAPEVETADLAPLVLTLAEWGTSDPQELEWLDPLPEASLAAARSRLVQLGALDGDGRITDRGRSIAALPLDPVSAAAILSAARHGAVQQAARMMLLLQERGLGGRSEDLAQRLSRWNGDRSNRATASRRLADGWAAKAEKLVTERSDGPHDPAIHLALAAPDNIAKARGGEQWLSAGGRGFRLDPASCLARAQWLVIGDAQGKAKDARITAALALDERDIEEHCAHLIERRSMFRWNEDAGRVEARREKRLGGILLSSAPEPDPDPEELREFLMQRALEHLDDLLPQDLLARARFLGIEAFSPDALRESAPLWLTPLLDGRRDLFVERDRLVASLTGLLDWESSQRLEKGAPRHFTSPAGTTHAIDYTGDDAPSVELRVQAMFGCDRQPLIGRTPLLLKLTSPAGRPIQSTRDLPGFWRGSWAEVAKDMKGRYPKHRWPDRPWEELPSLKTKNAFARSAKSD